MIFSLIIGFLLISLTILSIYNGFGPKSNLLKDPFEQNEA